MADLHDVISESIADSELPPDTLEATEAPESTDTTEVAPEGTEAPTESPTEESVETPEGSTEASTLAVSSPAAKVTTPAKPDEFEKKFGIPALSASGRENRIPYPRVKKIAEKAHKDGYAEAEATFTPKVTEYEAKITDYEGRLERVAEFENIMMNDTDKFLGILAGIPVYEPFFAAVRQALSGTQQPTSEQPAVVPAPVSDEMPQPDEELDNGTKVYTMEGLNALNAWNRAQARKETLAEVDKIYGPIQKEWEAHQKVKAVIPQVQAQIADAHTWKNFTENETEIVKALQSNPNLSLEGAYRQVVDRIREADYKKWEAEKATIQVDRNKMREDILKELKQAPRATSAPGQFTKAPPPTESEGPRKLEDVIAEQIKGMPR